MEVIARSALPLLILFTGLLFYAWIFRVILNDLRLTAFLKQRSPQRWKEITSSVDEFVASTQFIPGWRKARKHLRYLFSDEDCEIQEVLAYKNKIRQGYKLAIGAILGILLEILLVYLILIRR
jgi:hypothetical protein